jgi:hypothetical protein
MTSKTEIVIQPDGAFIRRTITDQELDIGDEVVEQISRGCDRRLAHVGCVKAAEGEVAVHLCCSCSESYWTVPLTQLRLRCPFHLTGDQLLVPALDSKSDPIMDQVFTVPPGMQIAILFKISNLSPVMYRLDKSWLFALSDRGDSYRLPLGNLYDDCSVCTGEENLRDNSALGLVQKGLDQIDRSVWNQDLWNRPSLCQSLFRFKVEPNGFRQVPTAVDWMELCNKVSVDASRKLVLPTLRSPAEDGP